jgi:hypothetical protein
MDWKLKWTDRIHEHVTVHVDRPTSMGHLAHSARHVLRPHLARILQHMKHVLPHGDASARPEPRPGPRPGPRKDRT